MPRPGRCLAVASLLLLTCAAPAARASKAEAPDDAFSLVQEQTVTSVAKRPRPLAETPAAVTIIPAAEIRAMGYHTLADALRWVRGAFVTNDRSYAYLGVRGVQRPGDYNNKILLTIDGHTMNGVVYGDALIGAELGLDLEDVERIEFARGPGSALYGSNAVLAVVNIVTRRARSEPGLSVDARTGSAGDWRGHVAYASVRPGWPEWRASVSWLEDRGRDLPFVEADRPAGWVGPTSAPDHERAVAFFGTAEGWGLRLAAKLSDRMKAIAPGLYAVPASAELNRTWDDRDFVELSTTRSVAPGLDLSARSYWDGTRYHGQTGRTYDDPTFVSVNSDRGDGDVLGGELRAGWAASAVHRLTVGVEAQRILRADIYSAEAPPLAVYDDRRLTGGLLAAYVQDEARVGSALLVTAGARLDDDSRYESSVSPRADLVWTFVPGTRLKLLGGSAFRAPTPFETSPPPDGAPDFGRLRPERVVTVEGTLEHESGALTTFLTSYQSSFRDLIEVVEVDPSGDTEFVNHSRMRARGLEAGMRFRPDVGTHARLGLAWQRTEDGDTHVELSNSPRWDAHALAFHTLRDQRTTLAAGVRFLSSRIASEGVRTPALAVCDARVARRVAAGVTVGLEANNLFDARYGDPGWGQHLQDVIPQDPRNLYLTVSYHPSGTP